MKLKRSLLGGVWVVMCLLAVGRAEAALDMALNIPGIPGDSTVPGFEGQINVLAWSWGASNNGTCQGPGQANLQDLSLTKYLDIASTPLASALRNGTVLTSATLTIKSAGTAQLTETIALSNVRVSSYSTGGSGGEDRLTENVTFNFSQAVITYYCVGGKGGACNAVTITAPGCP
jgi:type VI secretion system secreted protein Hcp